MWSCKYQWFLLFSLWYPSSVYKIFRLVKFYFLPATGSSWCWVCRGGPGVSPPARPGGGGGRGRGGRRQGTTASHTWSGLPRTCSVLICGMEDPAHDDLIHKHTQTYILLESAPECIVKDCAQFWPTVKIIWDIDITYKSPFRSWKNHF